MIELHEQIKAQFADVLAKRGYTQVRKVVRTNRSGGKEVVSIRFEDPDPEHGMTSQPSVEFYMSEAYPNQRGEIFACVWNWIGMGVKAPNTAAELTRAGTPARVTTKKKTRGLAIKWSPSWE
jgi:hypothetical protein